VQTFSTVNAGYRRLWFLAGDLSEATHHFAGGTFNAPLTTVLDKLRNPKADYARHLPPLRVIRHLWCAPEQSFALLPQLWHGDIACGCQRLPARRRAAPGPIPTASPLELTESCALFDVFHTGLTPGELNMVNQATSSRGRRPPARGDLTSPFGRATDVVKALPFFYLA
jgi:hypothetical protein